METEHFLIEDLLEKAKIIREERRATHGDTWKLMSVESLKDFAKSKIERYFYSRDPDDIIDVLVYLEFVERRFKKENRK